MAQTSQTDAAPVQTAQASETGSTVSEVVVTGLRASLQRSLDVKRNAIGVVDAISAEDIGKFPDSNVATAIERIPGVSVSRGTSSMGGLPTTTGDPTGITIRGFGPSFNETLYDGRQVASGTGNRGFDFSSVGADFVGEIDVQKTPDATLSSGAIGATINIKFPKPFDHTGFRLAGSASATNSPEDGKTTPNGGILISDTFANDTIGVLADIAYSDRRSRQNHINIQGWEGIRTGPDSDPNVLHTSQFAAGQTPPPAAWFIQDYGIYQEHTEDKRVDGRVVLQWRPSDNFLVTLNDDYSKDKLQQSQYGYSVWFNAGNLTNITTNSNGTITNFIQPNSPTDFQSQINGSVIENNEYGGNVKWDVSDHFKLDFDAARSESKLNPGGELSSIDVDVGYGPSCPTCTNGVSFGIAGIGANSIPYPTAYGPNGNTSAFLNPAIIGSHVLPISSRRNTDTIDQFKVQGTWADENIQARFGVQYLSDRQRLSSYDDFTNNQWQAYSGYGPASGSSTGVALPPNLFTNSFSTSNFINGFSGAGNLPPNVLVYDPYAVLNYLQGLGNPQTKTIPGFNTGCCNPAYNGTYSIVLVPSSVQAIDEKTFAAFLSLSYQTEIASMPLKVNLGVREEQTDTSSSGLASLPVSLTRQTGDLTALIVGFGPQSNVTTKNKYRYMLPNLDLTLNLTDQLRLRFDASRTLSRPPLTDLTPALNVPATVRVGALTATGGNPLLLPYLSDNLDFGAEWYYKRNSYASADVFVKNVTNFIVGGTTTQTINGVVDPTTGQLGQFSVTTNVNGPSAQVRGLELALQHVFGETGFGFQANATFVDTDKPYDKGNLSQSGFAVTGLANSANFVGFYDKGGFQARVAVNWRDDYLDRFGQQQNNSKFGSEPTFVKASTTVDFSTSYDITRQLSVYFEALNLTNETYATHGRYSEQLLDVIDYGRRFTLGVHFRM